MRGIVLCSLLSVLSVRRRRCMSNHPCISLRVVLLLAAGMLGEVAANNVLNGKVGTEADDVDNIGTGKVETGNGAS